MTDIAELLPCPFCGSTEIKMSALDDEDERRFWVREVECEACQLKMRHWAGWPKGGFDRQRLSDEVGGSLAKMWNRRNLREIEAKADIDAVALDLTQRIEQEIIHDRPGGQTRAKIQLMIADALTRYPALCSSAGAVKANGDAQDIADRLKRVEDDKYRRLALDAAMMIEYLNSRTLANTPNAEQVTAMQEALHFITNIDNSHKSVRLLRAALSGAE